MRRKPQRRSPDIDWRDVIAISADWYWEQDAELRFTYFTAASTLPFLLGA